MLFTCIDIELIASCISGLVLPDREFLHFTHFSASELCIISWVCCSVRLLA